MRKNICTIFILLFTLSSYAQITINGYVTDENNKIISGATIFCVLSKVKTSTDVNGNFQLQLNYPDTIIFHHIGYNKNKIYVANDTLNLQVTLLSTVNKIDEVTISTGYFNERSNRFTGSISFLSSLDLEKNPSSNLLLRLQGIIPGLQHTELNGTSSNKIRIRGLSTINSSSSPLIVLDGFPYEEDISTIDPDMVETITILKDASAASIWGARAGNGVIVIKSKNFKFHSGTSINFKSNIELVNKPDLHYNKNRLPSITVMEIEKNNFSKGLYDQIYNSSQKYPISEYVELLYALKNEKISESDFLNIENDLKNADILKEVEEHLLQKGITRNYLLNIYGGNRTISYDIYGRIYDQNEVQKGDNSIRKIFGINNKYEPFPSMKLNFDFSLQNSKYTKNSISMNDISASSSYFGISPYLRLMDKEGKALPIVKDYSNRYKEEVYNSGLLNWDFVPLEEIGLRNLMSIQNIIKSQIQFNYNLKNGFLIDLIYQYLFRDSYSKNHYKKESYYVRNIVNKYTQNDGRLIIPYGDIYSKTFSNNAKSHDFRFKISYSKELRKEHYFNALAGIDVRDYTNILEPGYTLYNYNDINETGTAQFDYITRFPTKPVGSAALPTPSYSKNSLVNRYLSYYSNILFGFSNKYNFSNSIRWDGSNLFGVKTNQKGILLWSIGFNWDIKNEKYLIDNTLINRLNFRTSYGHTGNVNQSVSSYPTITYGNNERGLTAATIKTIGNPSLKWEKVIIKNVGIDYSLLSNRLSGFIDFYLKKGNDLLGEIIHAPSTGIIISNITNSSDNLINYASINTSGFDSQLKINVFNNKLIWDAYLNYSYVFNKVKKYNGPRITDITKYFSNVISIPQVNKSMDVVYALPWYGLNPIDGLPLVLNEGEQIVNYQKYYNEYNFENLLNVGVSVPPNYGSIRNEFTFDKIRMYFNVGYKFGHVVRKISFKPGTENQIDAFRNYHMDYLERWSKPGDEKSSNIPATTNYYNSNLMYQTLLGYTYSKILIESASHIRLQDIGINYSITNASLINKSLKRLDISGHLQNLGIIWKASKGLKADPEYINSSYKLPITWTLSLKIDM